MKKTVKNIVRMLIVVLFVTISNFSDAQPPSPPGGGSGGGNGTGGSLENRNGGGAPIGGGLFILLGFGAVYVGVKGYRSFGLKKEGS